MDYIHDFCVFAANVYYTMIQRILKEQIKNQMYKGKAVIPRYCPKKCVCTLTCK